MTRIDALRVAATAGLWGVNAPIRKDAERAMRVASEGYCPLCEAVLIIHDGRACCVCCGDSYLIETDRLEIRRCPVHGVNCKHWQAVWGSRPAVGDPDPAVCPQRAA